MIEVSYKRSLCIQEAASRDFVVEHKFACPTHSEAKQTKIVCS